MSRGHAIRYRNSQEIMRKLPKLWIVQLYTTFYSSQVIGTCAARQHNLIVKDYPYE